MSEREIPDSLKKLQDEKRSQTLFKIQEVIDELKNDSAEVTKKKLIEMTGYSASSFSKQHVKDLLKRNKVCQYKEKLKVKPIKEDVSVRYEKSLEKANSEISRLKAVIVSKDIKINELEMSQKELQDKYEILLGQLHQITKKAHLKGIEV